MDEKETVKNLYLILGDDINNFLKNENVKFISINNDGFIYTTDYNNNKNITNINLSKEFVKKMITEMARHSENWCDEFLKIVLPNGEVFVGLLNTTFFSIQKRGIKTYKLDDFFTETNNTKEIAKTEIINSLKENKNILVIGTKRTGKTSFVDVLIRELNKVNMGYKIAILENTPEIVSKTEDCLNMISTDTFEMNNLIKVAMRFHSGGIIVDELKSADDIETLFKAGISGHSFIATMRAEDIARAFFRLDLSLLEKINSADIRTKLMYSAIDIIILLDNQHNIKSIVKINEKNSETIYQK